MMLIVIVVTHLYADLLYDVGSTQSSRDTRTVYELTAFQRTILFTVAEEPMYGLAIKHELESYYGTEVNHGRLYPNLDDLVERGLLEKSDPDKRTNQYTLTNDGYETILGQLT